jgi:type VI protein secretion system component Hcp
LSEAELSTVAGGSTGVGAGKITFNPFVITRVVDKSSPHLFL